MKTPATFKQRMALSNMYTALGKSTKGIRDMSAEEAFKAIDATIKEIKGKGFRKSNVEFSEDLDAWLQPEES